MLFTSRHRATTGQKKMAKDRCDVRKNVTIIKEVAILIVKLINYTYKKGFSLQLLRPSFLPAIPLVAFVLPQFVLQVYTLHQLHPVRYVRGLLLFLSPFLSSIPMGVLSTPTSSLFFLRFRFLQLVFQHTSVPLGYNQNFVPDIRMPVYLLFYIAYGMFSP